MYEIPPSEGMMGTFCKRTININTKSDKFTMPCQINSQCTREEILRTSI